MQRLIDYFFSVPLSPLDKLNAKDESGNTRLILAAADGDLTLMKDLLDQGADLEVRGQNGFTALAVAASVGQERSVDLLIKRGANIETETDGEELPLSYGTTPGTRPLAWAALYGHEAVVKRLLAAHAKVNKANGDLNTPLILAAAYGHTAIVRLLLQAGAQTNMVGQYGCTAEMAAERMGHQVVLDLLRGPSQQIDDEEYLGVRAMEIDSDNDIPSEEEVEVQPVAEDEGDDEEMPHRFLDAVSGEVMDSPIATKNGQTYDRKTLIDLFNHHQGQETVPCPVTRFPIELESLTYTSNVALKEEIQERRRQITLRREAERAKDASPELDVRAKRIRFFSENGGQAAPSAELRCLGSSARFSDSVKNGHVV